MSLTVDLHHHVIPDFYWEASNENGNAAGGINPPRRSGRGRSDRARPIAAPMATDVVYADER